MHLIYWKEKKLRDNGMPITSEGTTHETSAYQLGFQLAIESFPLQLKKKLLLIFFELFIQLFPFNKVM